ncbi:MAG: hypothetical protein EOO09_03215 [Chitinophagaceae bacterium]|nr:MAG: hypothetical protein EOO09_03215 [Chitinophagaceae bacterium]
MKKFLILTAVTFLLASCSNSPKTNFPTSIVGEWDSHLVINGKPDVFLARFKPNGSFDALSNGKLLLSGEYRTSGDTVFMRDGFCDMAYEGVYRFTFPNDSLRFDLVADTCQGRVHGSDKVTLGRVSSTK